MVGHVSKLPSVSVESLNERAWEDVRLVGQAIVVGWIGGPENVSTSAAWVSVVGDDIKFSALAC